jgi:hypothetical protein
VQPAAASSEAVSRLDLDSTNLSLKDNQEYVEAIENDAISPSSP